jgi:uncharacterized protein (UPF0276 family)
MTHSSSLGIGVGLRPPHFDTFLKERPKDVDWLEIISENYIHAHGGYWQMLADLRHDYPFVMHGVSLSIGSMDAVDEEYLQALKKLADFLEVAWVSDHLCYTGIGGIHTHDLLPIPYTEEALKHIIPRIHHVQEILKRPLTLENASSYLEWGNATLSESEFFTALHTATECRILLDLNNVYVSSFNHGWDTKAYIDAIPASAIQQYHMAGHTHKGTHIIDTHNSPATKEVWELYAYALTHKGQYSTLIEWDADIPAFPTLLAEVTQARHYYKGQGAA